MPQPARVVPARVVPARISPAGAEVTTPPPSTPEDQRDKTVWAYTTLGVMLACLAGGAALYGVGASQGSEAHEAYMASSTRDDFALHRDEVDAARTKLIAGHILVGVAAAALGVSIYHFITRDSSQPRDKASEAKAAVGLWPTPGGAALGVGGDF